MKPKDSMFSVFITRKTIYNKIKTIQNDNTHRNFLTRMTETITSKFPKIDATMIVIMIDAFKTSSVVSYHSPSSSIPSLSYAAVPFKLSFLAATVNAAIVVVVVVVAALVTWATRSTTSADDIISQRNVARLPPAQSRHMTLVFSFV